MFIKVFNCGVCNEQFLRNEWRWKRITIPVFIVLTTFTLVEYPFGWKTLLYHFIDVAIVIACLWVVNRNILVYFQHIQKKNKKGRVKFIKYVLTITVSLLIVSADIFFFHKVMVDVLKEECTHSGFMDIVIEHRYLFLITILFAYFINANYERLFLFIELTETGIMAEKYKKDSIESKFNNLKNKINPHFLFNTFNALSGVIEEEPPKASKLVNELSDVYRYVFDNQEANWVKLKQEVEFNNAYINLFKMRFEENFVTDIKIDALHLNHYLAPLTLQILIENAVKHNIISSRKPLKVDIKTKDGHIVVKNNLQPKKIINSGTSFGLKNLQERYKHLTNKSVEIIKTEDEFIVIVPLIEVINEQKEFGERHLVEN